MVFWSRTADGWAVNLDGSNATAEFRLPRIELHSGGAGWTCVCHCSDGMTVKLPLSATSTASGAKRLAARTAIAALGASYEADLRALGTRPAP